MSAASDASLGDSLCMNVRSFRKDGTPIATPVWVVPFEGGVAMFTDDRSFKAKRMRRNPSVEVAPCDVWGNPHGPWRSAEASIVTEPERREQVFALIAKKYGIHWIMATIGKRLTRTIHHRVVFALQLGPEVGAEADAADPQDAIALSRLATANTVVRALGVSKSYARGTQTVNAVNGVSLRVDAGEMVAIVGRSGSGKSTLLNLLGALDRPSSGDVVIAGLSLSLLDENARTLLRRDRIGFVFQFFNLLPLLDARENVALPLLLAGMPRRDAMQRADELLSRVRLSGRATHRPDQMSGGEMQRVALARALGPRPVLLLADEPTGNLDSAAGAEVLALLKAAAREQRCGVIMVTHDPRAAAVADRVLEFGDGRLIGETRHPVSDAPRSPALLETAR